MEFPIELLEQLSSSSKNAQHRPAEETLSELVAPPIEEKSSRNPRQRKQMKIQVMIPNLLLSEKVQETPDKENK